MPKATDTTGQGPAPGPDVTAVVLDMAGLPVMLLAADGRIESLNRRCQDFIDIQEADVIGRYPWDVLVLPGERNAVRDILLGCTETQEDRGFIGHVPTRTGETLRIEWTCRALVDGDGTGAIVVVGTGITNVNREEANARERSALLQSIINTSPEAIVVIDDHGIIRDFSPHGERMFGYNADEVIGHNVAVLMPQPYREEHDGYMVRYFETGEKRIIGKVRELVAQRKDGSTFPIELMVDEVFVNDIRLFTGFIRDVSLRKAAEEEVRKLNAELIHTGRVAAMGEMASAIAHEINQPLTAIANYIAACRHMLDSPAAKPDTIREIAIKADGQIARARDIVHHFRSFVRKGTPERQPADLNSLVSEALALALVGASEFGISVEVRLTPTVPAVEADGIQIQQVVLNLVRNAIEALGEVEERRLLITTMWQPDEPHVEFAVHDSGPGLASEIKDRLFQPFMTTKAQGMGIGLSLCRSIISAHDGRLWADSNDWGGTSFRFVLPVRDPRDGEESA